MNKKFWVCLVAACILTGCANSGTEDTKTSASADDITTGVEETTTLAQEAVSKFTVSEGEIDYKINRDYKEWVLKENSYYMSSDGAGVYFYAHDEKNENFNVYYQEFGSEKLKLLYHEDKFDFACSFEMCDEGLIFVKNKDSVNEVFLLAADNAKLLYALQGMRFPELSFYKEWMFVSYTESVNETSFLIKVNMKDGSATELYRTQIKYKDDGRATGDRIVFNGGTDERVYFQVIHLENQYDEECKDAKIYAYEVGKVELVLVPDDICQDVAGLNDRIILMEYSADDPNKECGKIYKEGCDDEPSVIAGIQNYNRRSILGIRFLGDLMLFNSLEKIYLYDTKTDVIKTLECGENDIKISYYDNLITYYSKDMQQVGVIAIEK